MPPPGFLPNLLRRVATAAVALPLLLAALFLGPAPLLLGIVGVALLVALAELYRLLEARGIVPLRLAGLLLAATFFLELSYPGRLVAPLWPVAVLVLLAGALARSGALESAVPAAGATLLAAVYVGALGGAIAGLRTLEPAAAGPWRVALLLAIVMCADTLAFLVGCAFGRHRLAPAVSPSKTVEGALGGLAGGVLGALALRTLGLPGLPLPHAVGLGVAVAALGILGDLDESLIKRWAGVKDSGALFPGHGGMLDRLDSLLFGAPVLYYYFLYWR